MTPHPLAGLLHDIAACRLCAADLPLPPHPVVQAGAGARLLIIGQAPGRKVHESGIPWNDASGTRLRDWLGLAPDRFYDPDLVAIMPMGFCYPGIGRSGSGDAPPMRRCAPQWHKPLLEHLPHIRLTLLIGTYAQARYLSCGKASMTEHVRAWAPGSPALALPHPSWRVVGWMRKNPWFETETLPHLRGRVAEALSS